MYIDVMDLVVHRLRMNGWVRSKGTSVLSPFRMMERGNEKVLIIKTLRQAIDTSLDEFIRGFFLILRLYIAKHKVQKIYVQAGGPIKMPFFFLLHCKKLNIEVIPVHPQKHDFTGFDPYFN
jgi:hypothetical protein